MKDQINILFLKEVGHYLDGEELKYVVVEMENGKYNVREIPIIYKGFISTLFPYLCYDFECLNGLNQARYEKSYKSLKKIELNLYSVQKKQLIKRKPQSFS